ncbi:MAG: YihY/virulence factor BrkB family protein [Acidimicrobiales bacterium]
MVRGILRRVDGFQRRHSTISFPLAVIYKFFDDQGSYLAALITYYGFLSLIPLLLLLTSILGFVLQGNESLRMQILDSAISQFPVLGPELEEPSGLPGSGLGVAVGLAIALYGALGVGQALQNAMNVMWAVPRHRRPNPLLSRFRGLALLFIGGAVVLATTVLGWIGDIVAAYGTDVGRGWSLLAVLAAVMLNTGVFGLAFRIATATRLSRSHLWPGALVAAIAWQLLQLTGAALVRQVAGANATYATFAVVLGLLGWLFLAALAVVLSVEINVVRTKRLYPRSLLTPFVDDVELTPADRRAYGDAALAQRAKSFQAIRVRFEPAENGTPADVPVVAPGENPAPRAVSPSDAAG